MLAPSTVLFEVGLHISIGDGGGRELLLALGALCCLLWLAVFLRLVILWWLCCCCCCCCGGGGGGGGPHLAFGGLHSAFVMMPSELVTMLIIKMLNFTCPCTFCKLQLPFLFGPDKIRVHPECRMVESKVNNALIGSFLRENKETLKANQIQKHSTYRSLIWLRLRLSLIWLRSIVLVFNAGHPAIRANKDERGCAFGDVWRVGNIGVKICWLQRRREAYDRGKGRCGFATLLRRTSMTSLLSFQRKSRKASLVQLKMCSYILTVKMLQKLEVNQETVLDQCQMQGTKQQRWLF